MLRAQVFLVFILLVGSMSRSFSSDEISPEQLPEDAFKNFRVLQKMKYPYAEKLKISVGGYHLYGDKYINSQGLSVTGTYFFSEKMAIKGSLYFMSNDESSEIKQVQEEGASPRAHAPTQMYRGTFLYRPVYGKLMIGNKIQRLFLGFEAGINIAKEKLIVGRPYFDEQFDTVDEETKVGPIIGIQLDLPMGKNVDISLNSHFFAHNTPFGEEFGEVVNESQSKWKTFWGNQLILGYRF